MTHTLALGAKLSSGARLGSRTLGLLRLSFASNVWISRRSRGTFTSEASGGVLTESSGSTGSSEALVDVDAASFSSSGGLIALVTHALWLSIDQGALGVGRTEDVGTGTCQMAVKEMMSDTMLLYKVMNAEHLLSHFAPWLGSGQTQNFPALQKALPGQSLLR